MVKEEKGEIFLSAEMNSLLKKEFLLHGPEFRRMTESGEERTTGKAAGIILSGGVSIEFLHSPIS